MWFWCDFWDVFGGSLQYGSILPSIWKEANVSPIFKKGDKTDPANYHSISLKCVLCKVPCKVLEHSVASNILRHLTDQNILYDLRHGFRERRSYETQLIMHTDELFKKHAIKKADRFYIIRL